jgi:hypothetical protein
MHSFANTVKEPDVQLFLELFYLHRNGRLRIAKQSGCFSEASELAYVPEGIQISDVHLNCLPDIQKYL